MHPRASRRPSSRKGRKSQPTNILRAAEHKDIGPAEHCIIRSRCFSGIKLIIFMSVLEKTKERLVSQTIVVRSETD